MRQLSDITNKHTYLGTHLPTRTWKATWKIPNIVLVSRILAHTQTAPHNATRKRTSTHVRTRTHSHAHGAAAAGQKGRRRNIGSGVVSVRFSLCASATIFTQCIHLATHVSSRRTRAFRSFLFVVVVVPASRAPPTNQPPGPQLVHLHCSDIDDSVAAAAAKSVNTLSQRERRESKSNQRHIASHRTGAAAAAAAKYHIGTPNSISTPAAELTSPLARSPP